MSVISTRTAFSRSVMAALSEASDIELSAMIFLESDLIRYSSRGPPKKKRDVKMAVLYVSEICGASSERFQC